MPKTQGKKASPKQRQNKQSGKEVKGMRDIKVKTNDQVCIVDGNNKQHWPSTVTNVVSPGKPGDTKPVIDAKDSNENVFTGMKHYTDTDDLPPYYRLPEEEALAGEVA